MASTSKNPLQKLADAGQAFWYDNIRRSYLQDGTLQKLIDDDGLRGVTANPTIFEHAISAGHDYDADIRMLVAKGADANRIYERLATDDVRSACDLLRPVYDRTNGADGFVSLEVSPLIATDTAATIKEVKRFWGIVDRPNLMVKIPATENGLPAIEQSLADGININITLIFAVERYIEVANAFVRALRQRVLRGEPIDRIASVASFFVSRVDTLGDGLLDAKIAAAGSPDERKQLESLKGMAGIANAKIAYERFKQIFYGDEFKDLRDRGAMVQRPLWASTSTKNPAYRDVMYVEELIGPDTVDTMPPATIDAFRDHGVIRNTIDEDVAGVHRFMERLATAGIDMKKVTQQLEDEGVASFAKSFHTLADQIERKRDAIKANHAQNQTASLGGLQDRVDKELGAAKNHVADRVMKKDATLWKPDAKPNDKSFSGWLGWLAAIDDGVKALDDLNSFVEQVRGEGYSDAVVLGMGGSSLAPLVMERTFGRRSGFLNLHVLDSTDPANVLAIERSINLAKTLFIVSSKSGSTTEPNTFFAYFWDKVRRNGAGGPGRQFVAITDAGSSLDKLAEGRKFRRVFHGDPEIGGRYSALSPFGLVPAALAGVDVRTILQRASTMMASCSATFEPRENPGVWLGTILGGLAKAGQDKVTFLPSPSLDSFGLWGEQLLAESTGKEGKGLIPIAGEDAGDPSVYGKDRVFVHIYLESDPDAGLERRVKALADAGQPVIRLKLNDKKDLGAEFFRWEFATAVAGAILGINPFDQPNVQESKDNTIRLLNEFQQKGSLPLPATVAREDGVQLVAMAASGNGKGSGARANGHDGAGGSVNRNVAAFLKQVKPGDYVAIMAYLPYDEAIERELQRRRLALRDGLHVATTLGFGPRFLHSTGQLHKGGPNSGLFIQVTAKHAEDVPVPGEPYSFGTLEDAQALGDLQSLQQHGRRVIGLHIEGDVMAALAVLAPEAVTLAQT